MQHSADVEVVYSTHVNKYGTNVTTTCFGTTVDPSTNTHVLFQHRTTEQTLLWCDAEIRAQGAVSVSNSTYCLPALAFVCNRSFQAVYRSSQSTLRQGTPRGLKAF